MEQTDDRSRLRSQGLLDTNQHITPQSVHKESPDCDFSEANIISPVWKCDRLKGGLMHTLKTRSTEKDADTSVLFLNF